MCVQGECSCPASTASSSSTPRHPDPARHPELLQPCHPELVSGSKSTEAAEIAGNRFRTKFGMTNDLRRPAFPSRYLEPPPRHPELVSGS